MKEGIHPNYTQTTIRCACGEVIETGIANSGGYPETDGKHVIVYTKDEKYKINGTEYPLDTNFSKKYPEIADLVGQLK